MQLIIVESPTKARTLSKFLGKNYLIEASMGHVRDLPKSELGVDIENNFVPRYIVPRDKTKRVNELKAFVKTADSIVLATDPDREGEAIAWHIAEIIKTKSKLPITRISFHEITESAIKDALAHPREIDMQMVHAQQARRILDRLVGYKLSPLLWQKLSKRWLSAGRVQSVATRLIVEREREIQKFSAQEYWTIEGVFETIHANLVSHNGEKYEKTLTFDLFDGKYTTKTSAISSQSSAEDIIRDLKAPYVVTAVDKKEVHRSPPAPFTTSTLQQDAGRKLYFSSKKTMQIAQKLYEEGYITYHRTDSVVLSDKFMTEARDYITNSYAKEYVPKEFRKFKTKSKVAQEAHEAIRPTDASRLSTPASATDLNRDHHRLYELIWKRALASQSAEAVFDATTIAINSSNAYVFECSGSVVTFDGYLRIAGRDTEEVVIPAVTAGQTLKLDTLLPTQHISNPPPRYTEASLVKTLEEKDIGRPSTYAPIISTIIERQYVTKEEKKLLPTELGFAVTDFLVKYFSSIIDIPFTATMEDSLDAIANGEIQWEPVIEKFYTPFAKILDTTYTDAEKVKLVEEKIDEKCPTSGHDLVVRTGRYGKFIACSNFPECTYTRQYGEKADIKCPRDGGEMILKKSKKGKQFYGCSNWPKCTFAAWKKEDIK